MFLACLILDIFEKNTDINNFWINIKVSEEMDWYKKESCQQQYGKKVLFWHKEAQRGHLLPLQRPDLVEKLYWISFLY